MAFFVAAAIAAVLALTSGRWLPALPTLFGAIEANSELIGSLADLTQIVTFVMLVIGAVLAYLGFRNLRSATAGEGVPQAVNVGEGGRGAAVGGDINRGAVVMGDHNRVEVFGDITYNYRDVAPSPVDAGTRESAGRQLEALPLRSTRPERAAFRLRHALPAEPLLRRQGGAIQDHRLEPQGGWRHLAKRGDRGSEQRPRRGWQDAARERVCAPLRTVFLRRLLAQLRRVGQCSPQIAFCGGAGGMNLAGLPHATLRGAAWAVMAEWQGELPRLLVFDNCEHENLWTVGCPNGRMPGVGHEPPRALGSVAGGDRPAAGRV